MRHATVHVLLAATAAATALACSCGREPSAPPPASAPAAPPAAAEAPAVAGEAPAGPVRAVPHEQLVELLPTLVGGWVSEGPEGKTVELPTGTFSHAQATYKSEEYPGSLLVLQISDGTGVPSFYGAYEVKRATRLDTPTLTYSLIDVGGQPAVEIASKRPLHTAVSVLVAGRFLVDAEAEAVGAPELRRFVESVDIAKLAGLR